MKSMMHDKANGNKSLDILSPLAFAYSIFNIYSTQREDLGLDM